MSTQLVHGTGLIVGEWFMKDRCFYCIEMEKTKGG